MGLKDPEQGGVEGVEGAEEAVVGAVGFADRPELDGAD